MEALRQFFPQILEYLDYGNAYPFLYSEQLLTQVECRKLRKAGEDDCRDEQIGLLVSILQRKGRRGYPLFYKALKRSVTSDELDCHLGHVELLRILPKPIEEKENERDKKEELKFPVMEVSSCTLQQEHLSASYPPTVQQQSSSLHKICNTASLTHSVLVCGATACRITAVPISLVKNTVPHCITPIEATTSMFTYAVVDKKDTVTAINNKKPLTDSGVILDESCTITEDKLNDSFSLDIVEKDSPRFDNKGQRRHSRGHYNTPAIPSHVSILSDSLTIMKGSVDRVGEEMKFLTERNEELELLLQNITKERNEMMFSSRNCLKYTIDPNQYPISSTIRNIISIQRTTSSIVSLLIILPLDNHLTEGETLHTCSLIISALFGLPLRLASFKLHSPFQLVLFNNDTLRVTITDTLRANFLSRDENPDLIIGLYTTHPLNNIESYSCKHKEREGEIFEWANTNNVLDITVQLSLDHCINGTLEKHPIARRNVPIEEHPIAHIKKRPVALEEHPITRIEEHPITRIEEHPITRIKEHPITRIEEHPITRIEEHPITRIEEHPIVPRIKEHKDDYIHVLPIHHHLLCLSFHLSHFYVSCIEKSATKTLQYTLVDCNRHRLKKTSDIHLMESIKDDLAIYEMDLFCV